VALHQVEAEVKFPERRAYSKHLPLSVEDHEAITEIHKRTGKPIYMIGHELIDLALRAKRIRTSDEVKS
jgi:hypothetical protein